MAKAYIYFSMKPGLLLSILTFLTIGLFGQSGTRNIEVKKTSRTIILDGALNDEIWENVTPQKNFYQYFPSDSLDAKYDTEIYLTYDDQNIYVAAKCYAASNAFRANSLKRDYGFFFRR